MVVDERGHSRRQILKGAIGAAGIVLAAPIGRLTAAPAQAVPEGAGILRLSDDLFVVTIAGESNVIAHTSPDGVLLVDGGSARASGALMKAISGLPGGGRVQTIFNTHWHPEQTGSNEQLGQAGSTIIAHENTRLWLTTDVTWPWNGQRFKRLPKIAQPNKTFYTTGTLESPPTGTPLGRSLAVRYGYIPDAAHTDGDMYVYFAQQNVLAVGDAVSSGCRRWPMRRHGSCRGVDPCSA
jgi:glyoxylase-like metal-dependent hydrolase (beta-lactamase superfamily II)